MRGTYFGYDGPCPLWNDSVVHHYVFTLYALDVERAPVDGECPRMSIRAGVERSTTLAEPPLRPRNPPRTQRCVRRCSGRAEVELELAT